MIPQKNLDSIIKISTFDYFPPLPPPTYFGEFHEAYDFLKPRYSGNSIKINLKTLVIFFLQNL